jgi:excisionase family DNA binding protein
MYGDKAGMTASLLDKWLTAREAAAHLRVAHRTILLWAKTGRIPAHPLSGNQRVTWRFRASELDAFVGGLRDSIGSPSVSSQERRK